MFPEIYPWQIEQWKAFVSCAQNNRLHHALLLHGCEGHGIRNFAQTASNYMVCQNKTDRACHQCKNCLLFKANTHPDIIMLSSKNNAQIKIQQVRALADFLGCHSNQGGFKVIIISPAEQLNVYAANALLKSLEEPKPNTLILLTSHHAQRLPATIVSRCEKIGFPLPDDHVSKKWLNNYIHDDAKCDNILKLTNGRPLSALKYFKDGIEKKHQELNKSLLSFTLSEKALVTTALVWEKYDCEFIFEWMIAIVSSIIRYKMTYKVSDVKLIDINQPLIEIFKKFDVLQVFQYYDWLIRMYEQIENCVSLNKQILIDSLLIRWQWLVSVEG